MAIATPYQLPFAMTVPYAGVVTKGSELELRVALRGDPTPEILAALAGVVTAWVVLARTGALGGRDIPAARSTIADHRGPLITGRQVAFTLAGVAVDERAPVVLAHLLHSEVETLGLSQAQLSPLADLRATTLLACDPRLGAPYPGIDRTLAFPCRIARGLVGEAQVLLRFAAVLDGDQRKAVGDALLTWACVAAGGAYAVAPVHPLDCSVVAETSLEWVDEEAAWGLSSLHLHPGAFDGLVNVVCALQQRGLPVAELVVE